MEINQFIKHIAEQYDDTDPSVFNEGTLFKELEEYSTMLSEIEANLDSVTQGQNLVTELNKEGYATQKDRIDAMLRNIDSYMAANKEKVSSLEARSTANAGKNKSLAAMVSKLKSQLAEKEASITMLKSTIIGLTQQVDSLNSTVNEQKSAIAQREGEITARDNDIMEKQRKLDAKDTELNTVYYIFGTRKELITSGVIVKEGNILKKIPKPSDNMDKSKFKTSNLKTLSEIKLGITKSKDVITQHPADSYYFAVENKEVTLKITDAAKFWSLSKYLIVTID
jgi:uncharacterized protein (DUF3084 family)